MAVISSSFLWLSEVTVAAGGAREKMASKARGVKVGVFTWEDGEQNFSSFFDLAESCCLRGSLPKFVADTSPLPGLQALSFFLRMIFVSASRLRRKFVL